MRGQHCSLVDLLKKRQQLEAAELGQDVADLRCVHKSTVSRWKRSLDVVSCLDGKVAISQLEHCQPSHFEEIGRHFKKLLGNPSNWTQDTRDSVAEWTETCEEKKWSVDKLKVELKAAISSDPPETDLCDVVPTASALIASGAKFSCIYADPPWKYDNQGTRASTDNHYPTLSVDELCDTTAWPIAQLAADNAHLHLWTTSGFLFDAKRIIEAWGFEYKSYFVWVKPQMGMGNYWRMSSEILLLGVRGSLSFKDRSIMNWLESPRTKHSKKPEAVRGFIERATPGPRLEIFGREQVTGWTVLGNQVSPQGCLV